MTRHSADDARGGPRIVGRVPRRDDRQRRAAEDRRDASGDVRERPRGPDVCLERLPRDALRAAHPCRRRRRLLRPAPRVRDRPCRVRRHLDAVRDRSYPRGSRLRVLRSDRCLLVPGALDHHRASSARRDGHSGSGPRRSPLLCSPIFVGSCTAVSWRAAFFIMAVIRRGRRRSGTGESRDEAAGDASTGWGHVSRAGRGRAGLGAIRGGPSAGVPIGIVALGIGAARDRRRSRFPSWPAARIAVPLAPFRSRVFTVINARRC